MRKFVLSMLLVSTLTACSLQTSTSDISEAAESPINTQLPPLSKQFACLPKDAAIIAAHRGTAYNKGMSENSLRSLKALIDKGYLMAEVDIAGLKDGTHTLFHDGVWEEDSTGKGPVAASTWNQVKSYLLNDTDGELTSDTLSKLSDYLKTAKDKIYLEIDFKSSAKYDHVINMIREHDMTNQVILISYNERQSRKLAELAPDMMLSVSVNETEGHIYKPGQIAAWLGDDIDQENIVSRLNKANIPVLGRIGKDSSSIKSKAADVLVTDYAFSHDPVSGLTEITKIEYEACLKTP